MITPDRISQLLSKIVVTKNGCWESHLAHRKDGYKQVKIDGKKLYLHRFIKEYYDGSPPPGAVCDHLCRNRGCCNPKHLEYVTPSENSLRSPIHPYLTKPQEDKTHCPYGHLLSGSNVYIRKDRPGRECRQCRTKRQKQLWQTKKSKS